MGSVGEGGEEDLLDRSDNNSRVSLSSRASGASQTFGVAASPSGAVVFTPARKGLARSGRERSVGRSGGSASGGADSSIMVQGLLKVKDTHRPRALR